MGNKGTTFLTKILNSQDSYDEYNFIYWSIF